MTPTTAIVFVSILLVFVLIIIGVFGILVLAPEIDIARLGMILGFLATISNILSGALGYLLGKNNSN